MKLTKERKNRSKKKYSTKGLCHLLMDNLPDRIFYKDIHSRYILINKTYADDLGISPEDVIGKTDLDIFPRKLAEQYRRNDREVIKTGKRKDFDEIYEPGNKQFIVHTIKVPVKDRKGKVIGILGIAYDITEKVNLIKKLKKQLALYNRTFRDIIKAMVDIVETRDPYTAGHQKHTTEIACAIAKEMGLSRRQIENIRIASMIHDFGKIFIPADILNKPAKLNDVEFNFVKTHPAQGYKLANDINLLAPIAKIIYQHHERIDGSGYPDGAKDGEISLEARVIAVADVIEAMTSHRPYRPAHPLEEALEEIEKNAGILYDKKVAKAALKLFRKKHFSLRD